MGYVTDGGLEPEPEHEVSINALLRLVNGVLVLIWGDFWRILGWRCWLAELGR